MKLFQVLMLIVLLSYPIMVSSSKILNSWWHFHHHTYHYRPRYHPRPHQYHRRVVHHGGGYQIRGGKFVQFVSVAIIQLSESSNSQKFLKKCFGSRIQRQTAPDSRSSSQTDGHLRRSGGPLQTVLRVVGKVIKIVCKLKGLCIKILKKLCVGGGRRRLFIQTGSKWGWHPHFKRHFKRFIRKARHVIKRVARAIKHGFNFMYMLVKKFIGKVWRALKNLIHKLTAVFRSKPFLMFKRFLSCVLGGFGYMRKLRTNIIRFIQAVRKLTNTCGAIQVFIKAVCQWRRFYNAAKFLFQANRAHGSRRWGLLGSFLGGFALAIAKSS